MAAQLIDELTEQWEYRVEVFDNPDINEVRQARAPGARLQDCLNRLGAEGWELVSTVTTVKTWFNLTGNDLVFLFKRPGVGEYSTRPEDAPGFHPY